MLLYSKISKMTSFSIKSAELGKITNLIASDLSVFSLKIVNFIFAASFVNLCIGISALLIWRIGWVGIISVVIVLLYLPLTNKLSEVNSEFVKEINQFKDRRVKVTTEVIEGIKYVKLYGWELAFKKIIQKIREQ
jgi:ATP-binding cassette subfamily C (CFTR/MRP) protein 4